VTRKQKSRLDFPKAAGREYLKGGHEATSAALNIIGPERGKSGGLYRSNREKYSEFA
jgi:hypothetical protein